MTASDYIIWKPVVGFEKHYEVSNTGLIRRITGVRGRAAGTIVRGNINHDGYVRIDLRDNGRRVQRFAHVIVMQAFVGLPPEGHEVNHKDGVRNNNHLSNLEYKTHGDNVRYSFHVLKVKKTGAKGERNSQARITEAQAIEIKRLLKERKLKKVEIAARMNVSCSIIMHISRGETWTYLDAA